MEVNDVENTWNVLLVIVVAFVITCYAPFLNFFQEWVTKHVENYR